MIGITQQRVFISGTIILALILLEWRSSQWPGYRRATVGVGTFLLNAVVLVSIFMMVIAALLASLALMQHAR